MSIKNRATLKTYFETGDKPTQSQFSDLIDSAYNQVDDPDLGGGQDSVTYTNTTPTPTTQGGIVAGSVFTDKTMKQMWDLFLYPYQLPAFTSFTIAGQTVPLEVGDSILANRTFTWSATNSANIATNSLTIRDVTESSDLITGMANTGSQYVAMSSILKTTATSNVFRIIGVNTNGGSFSLDYSVPWYWRIFYGESVSISLNEAGIEGLRVGNLTPSFAGNYVFAAGGYKYICYPSVLGTATTFKDSSTNLDVPFQSVSVVSVTNSFGITTNYNVHRTTNIIGSAITIIVS